MKFYTATVGNTTEFEASSMPALADKIINYYDCNHTAPEAESITLYDHEEVRELEAEEVNAFNSIMRDRFDAASTESHNWRQHTGGR